MTFELKLVDSLIKFLTSVRNKYVKRYCVYNPKAGKPTVIHYTYESAKNEAQRIANVSGDNLYILEIKQRVFPTCKYINPDLLDENEVPF